MKTIQEAWKERPGIVVLGALVILAAIAAGVSIREKSKPKAPAVPALTMTPMAGTSNPAKVGMFISSDGSGNAGTWVAMTGAGTPFTGTVQPVGLAVSVDGTGNPGTWAAASSTTFTSAVGGSATAPGIVATLPATTLSTTSGFGIVGYTPATGGLFRLCGYYMITAPATTGGNSYMQVTYTSNGHSNSYRISNNLSTTSAAGADSTSTTGYPPCQVVWGDPGQNMNIYTQVSGITAGTPTFVYSGTIERLI